ncbi:MAG: hypothetical protein AMK72_03060 [Planctomycetes bacterium SM23_25]|nr:MAG: hypothetical protein AMK72_03060 [Planctomycetes bacterium SM23_25]
MIYAAFTVYLLGIFFMALGIYRLWAEMLRPRWVSWALLPGTVVSEMAYIFGCLITGDLGPVIAAFMSILACGAGIVIVHALLGEPVIGQFAVGADALLRPAELPRQLPTHAAAFWDQFILQVRLLRRMAGTWLELDWLNWRVPLFVYLATCLSIRLAPVRRSLRATLAAVVVLAAIIAIVGVIWRQFDGLMGDIWPLVTYVWSSLLFLLAVSLLVRGAFGLVRALLQE